MNSPTVAAYLLVSDTAGRWLVVHDADSPTQWRLPGRIVTADDESPAVVAVAATAEHTGLQLAGGPLLAVRWIETAGCLALIFSAFVLNRAVVDHSDDHVWRMVSPQFAHSRLHPLIDQALADIPVGGPVRYGEHAAPISPQPSEQEPEPVMGNRDMPPMLPSPTVPALGGDSMDTAAGVLTMAHQVADQTIARAHREADETLGRARREANDIVGKARRQSEQILARAQAPEPDALTKPARRGIRTAARATMTGSTIQSTFPCRYHSAARLVPADVTKLTDEPDASVRRRCSDCGLHYDVYLIDPTSEPRLEWLVAR